MKSRFLSAELQRLYTEVATDGGYAAGIGSAFRKRMQTIIAAVDERTFYNLRSLRFEKLKGKRSHQYSMRLNDQWRLVLELEGKGADKVVAIISIEDYH
jgi:toxin HigB-1